MVTKWIPAGRSICLAHINGQIFGSLEIKQLVLARLFYLCCIYQMEFKVMQRMCLWLFPPCFTLHERQKLTFEYFRGDAIKPIIALTSQFCDLSRFGWLKRRQPLPACTGDTFPAEKFHKELLLPDLNLLSLSLIMVWSRHGNMKQCRGLTATVCSCYAMSGWDNKERRRAAVSLIPALTFRV